MAKIAKQLQLEYPPESERSMSDLLEDLQKEWAGRVASKKRAPLIFGRGIRHGKA